MHMVDLGEDDSTYILTVCAWTSGDNIIEGD